ncbi:hypothetical protein GGS20DRAFT_594467 [Poronia punctata]|nr:hypothetical protein GGS20DRAFT_594467 [Poronia punctata]
MHQAQSPGLYGDELMIQPSSISPSPMATNVHVDADEDEYDPFGADLDSPLPQNPTPQNMDMSLDTRRLQAQHNSIGYREGITRGKASAIQAGFDQGYALGANIGLKAGQVLGLLEAISAALSKSGDGDKRAAKLLSQAADELNPERLFTSDYWAPDGTWTYPVTAPRDGGELTYPDIAEQHPLIAKWTGIAKQVAEERRIDREILILRDRPAHEHGDVTAETGTKPENQVLELRLKRRTSARTFGTDNHEELYLFQLTKTSYIPTKDKTTRGTNRMSTAIREAALREYAKVLLDKLQNSKKDVLKFIRDLETAAGVPSQPGTAAHFNLGPPPILGPRSVLHDYATVMSFKAVSALDRAMHHAALWRLTPAQLDYCVLICEMHFWRKEVERLSKNYSLWQKIFAVPRQRHREARGLRLLGEDRDHNLKAIRGKHTRDDWTHTIVFAQTLPFRGPQYRDLKATWFRNGIDCMLQGYQAHTTELDKALTEFMIRINKLKTIVVDVRMPGITNEYLDRINANREHMFNLCKSTELVAHKYYTETCAELRAAQLPGANYGLRYGIDVETVYDFPTGTGTGIRLKPHPALAPVPEIIIPDYRSDPTGAFFNERDICSPIPLRPTVVGSPWRAWLRNARRPLHNRSLAANHEARKDVPMPLSELKDYGDQKYRGPIELELPHALFTILDFFKDINYNEGGPLPDKEKKMNYSTNHALKHRPIYDGAGNLRLDYMNAILYEIRTGATPEDYRDRFTIKGFRTPVSEEGASFANYHDEGYDL